MSNKNTSRLFKNTLFLYVRLLLTLGVSLYTSRIIINVLGVEDFGIYAVVSGSVALVAFLNSAMSTSTQRFLSIELGSRNAEPDTSVFGTAFNIHLVVAIAILVMGQVAGYWLVNHTLTIPPERLDAANWVLQCTIGILILNVIQVPFTAVIISRERMGVYAYMSFVDVGLKLIIVFLIGLGDFDKLRFYAILQLLSTLTVTLIYMVYCLRKFEECKFTTTFRRAKAKEMVSFVGWNLTAQIASVLSTQGVNMLLNIYFGPILNAARGVAVQASGSIQGFVGSFQTASAPQIMKTYAANEIEEEKELILFACKITLLLMILMALPVFLETSSVLKLWLGKVPPNSDTFLKLILVDTLICTSANPMFQAIMATGRIKRYQAICSAAVFAGILVSWFLLHQHLPASSVFVVAIGVSIFLTWRRLVFLRDMIGFSFRRYAAEVLLPGVGVAVTSAAIPLALLFSMEEGMQRLLLVTITCGFSTIVSTVFLGLNKKELKYVKSKVLTKLRKT